MAIRKLHLKPTIQRMSFISTNYIIMKLIYEGKVRRSGQINGTIELSLRTRKTPLMKARYWTKGVRLSCIKVLRFRSQKSSHDQRKLLKMIDLHRRNSLCA